MPDSTASSQNTLRANSPCRWIVTQKKDASIKSTIALQCNLWPPANGLPDISSLKLPFSRGSS